MKFKLQPLGGFGEKIDQNKKTPISSVFDEVFLVYSFAHNSLQNCLT